MQMSAIFLACLLLGTAIRLPADVLNVRDFGARGDGTTDDGPAIQRAVVALRDHRAPGTLRFEKGRTYRARTGAGTWLIRLQDLHDVTIDGNGAVFVLDPHLRFLNLTGCARVTVRNLSVDFDPLPFADGTVVAVDPAAHAIDVRIHPGFAVPAPGGPTGEREQAFFGMLWHPGPHGLLGEHYFLRDVREAGPGKERDRIVRAIAVPEFGGFAHIRPGITQISLPIRGIAHKMEGYGASPAFVVEENDTVRMTDISLWSAPLMGVSVARNRGVCTFRRFHVRPKPGASRLTSTWRDAFHVKANYARLLWEDCDLEGMNDDAFNTATHSSRVVEAISPTEVRIRQSFPLFFVPFRPGDVLGAYDAANGRLLGNSPVAASVAEKEVDPADPERPAPPLRVTLTRPLPGLKTGDVVWNVSSANPHTTIRRCRIRNSCRFQSPVTVEDCDIVALCWFYGDDIEGPLPRDVVVRRSRLWLGRGNPEIVASFAALIPGLDGRIAAPREPVIHNVLLEDNSIDGVLEIGHAANVRLIGNRFLTPRGRLVLHDSRAIVLEGNRLGAAPLESLDQIQVGDEPTRGAITIHAAHKGGL